MSGALLSFTTGERRGIVAARTIAFLPVLAALAASPAMSAETARAAMPVGANVEASCEVTTRTGTAVRAASSCKAITRAAVTLEQVELRASSRGARAAASGQVTRVTVTF